MAKQRMIAPVANNSEKQITYNEQMKRYNRAMKEEFYLEALMIDYAVLEDRMRSLIYYMGFISNRSARGVWKKTRPYLLQIVSEYKDEKENLQLGLFKISSKMKILRTVLLWALNTESGELNDPFLRVLKEELMRLEIQGLLDALQKVSVWCDYRNEVVHALMNKNVNSFDNEKRKWAEEGMELARFFDAQERRLRSTNKIRKKLKLPLRD